MANKNIDEVYMKMTNEFSKLSHSENRLKVGCLIVKDTRIISTGFNGTPFGFDNTTEDLIDGKWISRPEVLHAESNAIIKCAKYGDSCSGGTLYVTVAPCFNCAKLIIQSGISKVVYRYPYVKNDSSIDNSGIILLKQAHIKVSEIHVELSPW